MFMKLAPGQRSSLVRMRQNAPFCVLAFKCSSAVPTSRTSFQIAPECTISYRPWFVNVLSCLNFRNNAFLITSECTIYCPHFQLPSSGKEQTYCHLCTHINYSLLNMYSRSYWPDYHTVNMNVCIIEYV